MGILTELDVVNEMLGALGEIGLNSLVNAPPLATKGQAILRRINAREQAKGWWFNREVMTITPDANGYVTVPDDVLEADPTDPSLPYIKRGEYMYDPSEGAADDPRVFTLDLVLNVVRLVAFDDLPVVAQDFVSLSAQKDFVTDMDGDQVKMAAIQQDRREAWAVLNAEHTRQVDANLFRTPSIAATLMNIRGSRRSSIRFR
jgi:hypothetical protein